MLGGYETGPSLPQAEERGAGDQREQRGAAEADLHPTRQAKVRHKKKSLN